MNGSENPYVVLVHGSPGSPRSWDGVAKQLEARVPDAMVVRVALPGWGERTPGPVETLEFDQIVERIVAGCSTPDRPVTLVGFSAGAVFALALARRAGWTIRALLLLEPMGLPALRLAGAPADYAQVRAALERYFAGVEVGSEDAIEPIMDVWYPPGSYAAMPAPVKAYLRTWAPLNVRDGRAVLSADLSAEWFGEVTAPTIVTYGEAAPAVWRHFAEATASLLPRATVRAIPGGTHALLDTHPGVVAELIAECAGR